MTAITTDNLVKAIANARSKDNVVIAIANATQGKPVSEGIQAKVKAALAKVITGDKAEQAIASIVNILKASEGLPIIREQAQNLFAGGAVRKGSAYTATRAGITAWNEGKRDNELTAIMSEKCPVLDPAEKAKAELLSLLTRAKDKAVSAGKADMAPALEALMGKLVA